MFAIAESGQGVSFAMHACPVFHAACSIAATFIDGEASCPSKPLSHARKARREGKAASIQAGEFVHEEIEHIRHGKHGARSAKQAIAIGLSKARKAGVDILDKSKAAKKTATKKSATKRATCKKSAESTATRRRAACKSLKKEGGAASRSTAAKKAVKTKGAAGCSAAAKKAARTRAAK